MTHHRSNETSVVSLFADHFVVIDKRTPSFEEQVVVLIQRVEVKRRGDLRFRPRSGKAETVYFERTSGDYPELIDHLRDDYEFMAVRSKLSNRITSNAMLRMFRLNRPQQKIGVDENSHSPRPA